MCQNEWQEYVSVSTLLMYELVYPDSLVALIYVSGSTLVNKYIQSNVLLLARVHFFMCPGIPLSCWGRHIENTGD